MRISGRSSDVCFSDLYDGLTLSPRQKTLAEEKLAAEGLSDRSHILLTDYRDAVGQYDAIASVEMVEAVGQAYWPDYLAAIHRLQIGRASCRERVCQYV